MGAFSRLYALGSADFLEGQNLTFIREIFAPVFLFVKNKYDEAMGNNKFTIKFMGTPKLKNHYNFFTENGFNKDYEDIGLFPGNIENVKGNLENTLFVNAWDMLSVVGNGNALDVSLDGFIGRNTSVAVLSTSLTNPYIKKYDNNPNYISVTNLTNSNFCY